MPLTAYNPCYSMPTGPVLDPRMHFLIPWADPFQSDLWWVAWMNLPNSTKEMLQISTYKWIQAKNNNKQSRSVNPLARKLDLPNDSDSTARSCPNMFWKTRWSLCLGHPMSQRSHSEEPWKIISKTKRLCVSIRSKRDHARSACKRGPSALSSPRHSKNWKRRSLS